MNWEFGALVTEHLRAKGMTMRGLAKAVGSGHSTISQVVSGLRSPPLERVEAWAQALGLTGPERETFLAAAHLAHASTRVREIVVGYESESARQSERIRDLERAIVDLSRRLAADDEQRHGHP